jgi:cell division protein FtsB
VKATRGNTGPGRAKKRSGAGVRPSLATPRSADTPTPPEEPEPRKFHAPTITRRAFVLILVVMVLALSYANTLRIYIGQQHDLAVVEEQIRERSARIAELEDELARWNDPEYVKTQARSRLGWVMPGETGFHVVGEDGKPVAGGVVIESEAQSPEGEYGPAWWSQLWGSMETADAPKRKVVSR